MVSLFLKVLYPLLCEGVGHINAEIYGKEVKLYIVKKFEEFDMVIVNYKGTNYPMCVFKVDKCKKQLHVKSLKFDNFEMIVGFDEAEKVENVGF